MGSCWSILVGLSVENVRLYVFLHLFLYYLRTYSFTDSLPPFSQATTQDSGTTTQPIHVGNAGNDTRGRTRVRWLIHPGPTIPVPTTTHRRQDRARIQIFRSRCLISGLRARRVRVRVVGS